MGDRSAVFAVSPRVEPSTFTALSLIGAPALLTNATSVLLLSTANRLGRSVDRARQLAGNLATERSSDRQFSDELEWQLATAERRVLITVRAKGMLYLAVGAFAASTLAAFTGAAFAAPAQPGLLSDVAVAVTMLAGATGFGALALSAAMLVRESQLAYRLLHKEASHARRARQG